MFDFIANESPNQQAEVPNRDNALLPARLPIIGFDANPWVGSWMNRQELLSRLAARGWPVIYSNGALSLWDRGTSRWADSAWRGNFAISDGVRVDYPGRLTPRWQSHNLWDRWSMRHHARRLRHSAGGAFMAYLFNPLYFEQVEHLNPKYVLFHVRDYYPGMGNWTREDQYRLDALADRADLITIAGEEMAACIPASASAKIRLLANATDYTAYSDVSTLPCPSDLATIAGPRIGLVGNVNPKVDLSTLLWSARQRPEYQFIVIGDAVLPQQDQSGDHADNWRACLDMPNIHWFGRREHTDLPAYMAHMDVNIMLYRAPADPSSWVHFINPLKMFSCLAAGKPVISSDIPAVRPFADVIHIAKDRADWGTAIDQAIRGGGVGTFHQRRSIAFPNNWESRVDDLEGWLYGLTAARQATDHSEHSAMRVKPLAISDRHFAVD